MRIIKLSAIFFAIVGLLLVSGCNEELKDCRIQNDVQRKQLDELRSEIQAARLTRDQLQRQLESIEGRLGVDADSLKKQIAALEEDLAKKKSLISSMQQQLLYGGAQLPVEISTMLEDFAKKEAMVTFDSARGIVKFNSDLLFEKGSDAVAPAAEGAVKELCGILGAAESENFDIVIAGHTDDVPIGKPETRQKHPTNWHLSVHRAISVLNIMSKNKIAAGRMSVRGFGEYRPAAENKPNKGGNPQNRRVELYLVAHGM